jgi:hypothetical protein
VASAPTSAKATIPAVTYAPTTTATDPSIAALWMAGAVEPAPLLMAQKKSAPPPPPPGQLAL